jgi:phosphatidylglycerol:prolipoprotein diacylglycerol transferase
MNAILFPNFDPIIVKIGVINITWYGFAYLTGILLGFILARFYIRKYQIFTFDKKHEDDLIFYSTLGIIIGGRVGYMLVYGWQQWLADPWVVFKVWQGGMSFHGGALGFCLAVYLFCRAYKIRFLKLMDVLSCVAPLGIFFGRIANFINGELYGRPTGGDWGVIFPYAGPLPRHPSQIYEAALEGLLCFIILNILIHRKKVREHSGVITGLFAILYGIARFVVEFVREPDAQLGYLFGYLTTGQLLSLPLFIIGVYLLARKRVHNVKV